MHPRLVSVVSKRRSRINHVFKAAHEALSVAVEYDLDTGHVKRIIANDKVDKSCAFAAARKCDDQIWLRPIRRLRIGPALPPGAPIPPCEPPLGCCVLGPFHA